MAPTVFSQQLNRCSTTEVMQRLFQEDPQYKLRLDAIEDQTQKFIKENPTGTRTVVSIPVVVHVVYNTTTENISDAQVQSQIDVLNEDFRRLNADANETPAVFAGIAADCEINFCLAAQDPNGAATNGITRTSTTKTSFSDNNDVKYTSKGGHDVWDRNKYLNIWVCDLGSFLLGYAQFPGGAAATDGVVLHYKYTGRIGTATYPYQLGRSATHEVGHWLNLRHIWGDDGSGCTGSDLVTDTPNQADETYGCPLPNIRISCTNGPNGDLYSDYMDYTDDGCMNIFTTGQKTRMQALFATGGSRASLLTSAGCTTPGGGGLCSVPAGLNATGVTTTGATLNWSSASGAVSYNVQYRAVGSGTWIATTSSTTSTSVSGLTASIQYEFQVQSVCSGSSSAFSASTTFTTAAATCTDAYEVNNTKAKAKAIPVNTDITAKIGTSTDKDWFSFTNTASEHNIRVTLSNLPTDYDLDFYGTTGTKVTSSQNAGTEDETIVWNTTTVGTYKVRVYGAGGSFNSNSCYTLNASIGSSPFRTNGNVNNTQITGTVTNIYPNPSNGNMTVEYNSSSTSGIQLIAYDLVGRIIYNQQSSASEGMNSYNVNVQDLAPGVYVLEILNGSEVSRMKFSVQK
jgi:hypothetical protein